jgi:uncharacterized protein
MSAVAPVTSVGNAVPIFIWCTTKKDPDYRSFEPMDLTGDEEGLLFRCQHLQPDKTCGIYEQRPELCRQYPSEYTLLLGGKLAKGCGYQFRLLKPFSQVLQTAAGQQTH